MRAAGRSDQRLGCDIACAPPPLAPPFQGGERWPGSRSLARGGSIGSAARLRHRVGPTPPWPPFARGGKRAGSRSLSCGVSIGSLAYAALHAPGPALRKERKRAGGRVRLRMAGLETDEFFFHLARESTELFIIHGRARARLSIPLSIPKQCMNPSSIIKFPPFNLRSRRHSFVDGASMGETPDSTSRPLFSAPRSTGASHGRQFTLVYGCLRICPGSAKKCHAAQCASGTQGEEQPCVSQVRIG